MMCLEQKIGKESQLIAQFQTQLYMQQLQLQKQKRKKKVSNPIR